MIFYTHECEEIIGYTFHNTELLRTAFTHSSYSNEHKNFQNNERLEFLGDSVLGFVVADYLYNSQNEEEGVMTKEKQNFVSKKPLSNATRKLGIEKYLLLSENSIRNEITDNLCENLYEAIVGAIYIDGGIVEARKFIERTILNVKNSKEVLSKKSIDNISSLQMFLQQKYKSKFDSKSDLRFDEIKVEGPPHKPTFTVIAVLFGKQIKGTEGVESSKKKASQISAGKLYAILSKSERKFK